MPWLSDPIPHADQTVLGWFLDGPLMVLCIIVGAVLLRWLVHHAIRGVVRRMVTTTPRRPQAATPRAARVLRQAAGLDSARRKQRAETTGSILRSVSTLTIFAIAALTILARVGVPLGPLLASAGVGGVALGFGAQSLVKDFLSGIFMIIEDQYGVGDIIDTGQAIGTVEEVSLRVTRVRDFEGVVWYVRNGEILRVGNRSQGWSFAMVDIAVGYDQDLKLATSTLEQVLADLDSDPQWHKVLLESPQFGGVQSVSPGQIDLRVNLKCLPNEQWALTRELRGRAKEAFDAAGVKGPELPAYRTPPSA